MILTDNTNIDGAVKAEICLKDRQNFSMQSELICGAGNSFDVKFYGTLYKDADIDSDTLWADITQDIFSADSLTCAESKTEKAIAFMSNFAICKIKVVITPSVDTANNKATILVEF